jgi:hypothetical protein
MSNLDNYSFNVYPQVFAENDPLLKIGQRVIFNDGNGYTLDTRVLKLSTNLDFAYVQNVTVGNQAIKGTLTQLKEDVQTIVASGGSGGSGGGYSVAQFKNLIQRYGINYFLSKVDDDTASGNITFEKNVEVEQNLEVKRTAKFGTDFSISSDGTAVLGDTTAKDVTLTSITSKDYAKELYNGFSLAPGANGSYKLEIGDLEVWGKASFAQLEIRKVSYAGGTVVYSNAGSTLKRVASVTDASGNVIAYKCWAVADDGTTQTMNWWTVGMMALCQTFNVQDGTNTDQAANHYYWRLVIGKGQETLEDGKLYDYILLSNKKTFTGSDAIVPVYTDKCWAEENDKVIIFGSVAVAQCDRAMGTMAEGCDVSKDDGGTAVSSRTFYGYADGSDAPQADDVIVQVGDQVSWSSKGNLVMITTYNLNAKGNVPSISMYHAMGNLYAGTDGTANPYQWKTLTHLFSPEKTLVNSECFQFFTGSEDNVVSPISTTYDIIPSYDYLKKKDGKAEVEDILFTVNEHYGSNIKTYSTSDEIQSIGLQLKITTDGKPFTIPCVCDIILSLRASGYENISLDDITAITAFIEKDDVTVAAKDIPVINDGEDGKDGTSVTIKGSLASTDDLPTSGNTNGDGYMIDGNLWVYTGTTTTDTTHVKGFENVGQIKGEDGKDGTDGQSAYDVVIEGAPLVYETGDNGTVTDLSKSATIHVYQKSNNVTLLFTPAITCTNCEATVKRGLADTVTITKIDTQTVSGYTMSQQAGMVDVTLTYGSTTLHAQIPFQVNVVKMMGSFKADSESLKSDYTSFKSTTEGTLSKHESSISQNADAISMKVSKDDLTAAGIDIDSSSVTLYGDQVKVKNGDTTTALFTDGKVTASMLDATQIVTDGLQAQTIDAKNATIKNLTVESANVTGKVTASSGKIGGLSISGDALTNAGFNNDAFIVMRNDTHSTFVGIGGNVLPASLGGTRSTARFENNDTTGFTGYDTNYAIIAEASGATDNSALCINGGYIEGLRIKTRTYSTVQAIPRGVNCALLNVEGTFTLPDMRKQDDGYVLYVRHLALGNGVKIKAGKAVNTSGVTKTAYLLEGATPFSTEWTVGAAGDTVMLVYQRGLTNSALDSNTYEGCWLIMKMPRDW